MKKIFYFLAIILFAGVFSSCENGGGGGGSATGLQFKRMNIVGAHAIALASDESGKKSAPKHMPAADGDQPQYNVSNPVWTVSDDGTLVEVHYTIEVEGKGEIVDKVKANMRLVMQYIYSINNEWLWLVNCDYDYPGLDDVPEPLHGKIAELMHHDGALNFLVRKSDGALFEWKREQGCPVRGQGYKRQSDVYGQVETVGKDLFSCPSMGGLDDYYGRIYKLADQGDVLNVVQVLSSSQAGACLMPDSRGFVGTYLIQGELVNFGDGLTVTLDPNSLKLSNISTGEAELNTKEFISIDGTTYLIGEKTAETSAEKTKRYLFALENQSGMWTAKTPALLEWTVDKFPSLPDWKHPYKSATATWMGMETDANWTSHVYAYTIDPKAPSLTKKSLPAHYPGNADVYYDGIAYVMAADQNSFYVCDLAKDEAEQITVEYDESVAQYASEIATIYPFGEYDPNTLCFTATAQLLDGTYLYLILQAQGVNRGKVFVVHEGESDAGQVISVMVRLN